MWIVCIYVNNCKYFTKRNQSCYGTPDFFVGQHVKIWGKPMPFIRKAKNILKVVVKEVHPEMSNDLLMSELYE